MTVTSGDDLVLTRFYRVAAERPDAPYLTQPLGGGRVDRLSFARVLDEARRVASYLRSLELPPRSQIAIASRNTAHFVMTDLAIWMAGHVPVALYPTQDAATVRFILEHSESRLLFVGKLDAWEELSRGVPAGLPCVAHPLAPDVPFPRWGELLARHEPIPDLRRPRPEDWAYVFYTSGTTGRPKGVVHTFASASAATRGLVDLLGIGARDRYVSYLPLAHAMERWAGECVSLVSGNQVFFAESVDTFVEDLKRARPTLFLSVPRLWLKFQHGVHEKIPPRRLERLLRIPVLSGAVRRRILQGLGLDHVRIAGCGSAPVPPALLAWYRALGLELLEGYGMTENFAYSHVTRPGEARPGVIGPPYPGVECRLSADGEVLVKGPGDMLGYLKEPELTRESFTEDGFLRTGDRGTIVDGRLAITGRLKELFKTAKGKYVAPAPIESLLNGQDCVELCCVAGAGHAAPHAVVQLAEPAWATREDPAARAETTAALEELLDRVNARLVAFERLAFLAVARDRWTVEDGALTPTLKVRRSAIERRYAHALEGWYASGRRVIWEA